MGLQNQMNKMTMINLVIKRYSQIEGVDINEIFLLLHVILHLEQLDVKTFFLHGELEKDIYAPIKGFKEQALQKKFKFSDYQNRLLHLKNHYFFLFWWLNSLEYTNYHCTHYNKFDNNDFIILLLYVNDILVIGLNKD
ncbi:hypothetical protein CR513_59317, partial [Mucuna pruriens]